MQSNSVTTDHSLLLRRRRRRQQQQFVPPRCVVVAVPASSADITTHLPCCGCSRSCSLENRPVRRGPTLPWSVGSGSRSGPDSRVEVGIGPVRTVGSGSSLAGRAWLAGSRSGWDGLACLLGRVSGIRRRSASALPTPPTLIVNEPPSVSRAHGCSVPVLTSFRCGSDC